MLPAGSRQEEVDLEVKYMEHFATEEQQVERIKEFWKEHGKGIVAGAVIGFGLFYLVLVRFGLFAAAWVKDGHKNW